MNVESPEWVSLSRERAGLVEIALRRAIRRLETKQRRLLELHFVYGLGIDHLAPLIGVHRSSAARRIMLMDESAKENWLWPLLANRRSVRLGAPARLPVIVDLLERLVPTPVSSETPSSETPSWEDWGEDPDNLREVLTEPIEKDPSV